jgi:AcrR family transcriptional regulator
VEVVAERGFAGTTVKLVRVRAGMSSRTFYEYFDGLEDCFTAVLDLGLECAGELITEAFGREDGRRDGLRAALASLLVLLDSEPMLTRIWFIETLAAGSWALERREHNLALLRSMIVKYWSLPGEEQPEPLTVVGVMAAVLGSIHTHLITKEPGPLIELLGPLMGFIMAPYLDRGDVAREIERGARLARTILIGDPSWIPERAAVRDTWQVVGQRAGLSATSDIPGARRARECLLFLIEHPDSSNREVALGLDIAHQSQVSMLLAYLVQKGLVAKRSNGVGKRNASCLTPRGEKAARMLSEQRD